MHLVTSSLFLHEFIEHLAPHAQSILLRSYLASALIVWVSRGRPVTPIASFYSRTSPNLTAPGSHPTPDKETLVKDVPTPNAWLALLQSSHHLLTLGPSSLCLDRSHGLFVRSIGVWGVGPRIRVPAFNLVAGRCHIGVCGFVGDNRFW